MKAYQASEQAIQLLETALRNLGNLKNLQRIDPCGFDGAQLCLRAMLLAQFHRKLASFPLSPNDLKRSGYGILETPHVLVPYIKCLSVWGGRSSKIDVPVLNHKEENTKGLHIKDYRPGTPEFTDLIRAFSDLEEFEITGCLSCPRLRFCHGCNDLFTISFAPIWFPKLYNLSVERHFYQRRPTTHLCQTPRKHTHQAQS